ncbi:MAG TPA: SDR family oxidoreductase [Kofleriaceae bacterium]|jgi:NAD(P)-dependent dehydrogenase (short-subunit alcohol dehydrogenase family)
MTQRIALITGGSRGLGRSAALHLADRGTDIVITYKAAADDARSLVAEVLAKGRKAVALPLDVSDLAAFPAFAARLGEELARVWQRDTFDVLVNNAGTANYTPIADTTEATFDELFAVHLKGPYFLTQRLLPRIADGGTIINVSSGLTRFSAPGSSAYAIMKGGLEVFTRYLARELGPRKITANTIAPGAVATDFGGGHLRSDPKLGAQIAAMTALGRTAVAEDIGGAIAALVEPGCAWITGQRIEASGGMLV